MRHWHTNCVKHVMYALTKGYNPNPGLWIIVTTTVRVRARVRVRVVGQCKGCELGVQRP